MSFSKYLAVFCLILGLVHSSYASLAGGLVSGSSIVLTYACNQPARAGTNAALCSTFCRSGDCKLNTNVDAFAIPFFNNLPGKDTNGFEPSVVVGTSYAFDITNPTFVGITTGTPAYPRKTIVIISCRDSNCQNNNQYDLVTDSQNATFGAGIDATLDASSHLSIVYSQRNAAGSYDIILQTCSDPLCLRKLSRTKVGSTLFGTSKLWLGNDVATGNFLIVVSSPDQSVVQSYSCKVASTASLSCSSNGFMSHDAVTAFSLFPHQTKPSKGQPLKTVNWSFVYFSKTTGDIMATTCDPLLKSCFASDHNVAVAFPNTTADAVKSVSTIPNGSNGYDLAYSTYNDRSDLAAVHYGKGCKYGQLCPITSHGNFSLHFTASQLSLPVTLMSTSASGVVAFIQAYNPTWVDAATSDASSVYALYPGKFFGPVQPKKFQKSMYHKPPPKVTVALIVLASIAGVSTLMVIIWRVRAGRASASGYTNIN